MMSELEFPAAPQKLSIQELVAALDQEAHSDADLAPLIEGLSDLSPQDIQALEPTWRRLSAAYKHKILQALHEASETKFELNCRAIALLSVEDESGLVRAAALDLLQEEDSAETMKLFLNIARDDPDAYVKTRALTGLGNFILLGEYGEIPAPLAQEAQQLALQLHRSPHESAEVRRQALEALANSNHPAVSQLIWNAYQQDDHLSKASALSAMGRTCDAQWQDILIEELANSDSQLVCEALRACGEIQLESSLESISQLAFSDDCEIQLMAVWALGEIGGRRAFEMLSSLAEQIEDEEMEDSIDEALEAASFSLGGPMLDFH